MKWKLFELLGNRVMEAHSCFSDKQESNMVLNEDWCENYTFDNSFDSPEEAETAFKKLAKESDGKKHCKGYTFMTMICLPIFMFTNFDIEE